MIVISTYQVRPLRLAWQAGQAAAAASADLGLSQIQAGLGPEGVCYPTGERLSWSDAARIEAADGNCFAWLEAAWREIKVFSEETERVYTLRPTPRAPTLLISGLPMHRLKDVDPWEDTQRKLKALGRARGQVLDTSLGLGYTAIAAAQTAERVLTIEFDPAVLELAWHNPWSRELFTHPRIEPRLGDAFDVVPELPAGAFTAILHDPPTFSLAGYLYSGEFYRQLYRVLRPNGRLFHYIGNPASPSGARTTRGVVRRLKEAGFTRVEPHPEAFGVTAFR
jgi:hypothetical protein